MNNYKVLNQQIFKSGNFCLLPIHYDDRLDIMKWRNEQIYHLRQNEILSLKNQNNYFKTVVSKFFKKEKPEQILYSLFENNILIGYGGLVNINWNDKNAEISFIMNTDLENLRFHEIWTVFLKLLEKLAFQELKLHKIFTYAFDLRPHLYKTLVKSGYIEETRLKEHYFYKDKFIDIIIHSKINYIY